MADGRNYALSIVLGVVDKASEQLKNFNKSIEKNEQSIKDAGTAMVAFGGAVTASLGLAINAAGQQESEIIKLQKAVELSGNSYQYSKEKIEDFVSSMQTMTKYGDGETRPMLQKMLVYTNDIDKAFTSSKLAADLASSGLFDLGGATRMVGMAMNGNIEMLGRYIPELKASNNEQLALMTSSEKAEYALGILQKKFGDMASSELQSFPALVKQLSNYTGDLTEDIGDILLPVMKEFTKQATETIKGVQNWIKENPVLTQTIVTLVAGIGGLSLAVGSLLLIIPPLIMKIGSLWAIMTANPIVAITTGVVGLTTALYALAAGYVESKNKAANTGKTHEDLIALHKQEIEVIKQKMADTSLSLDEQSKLQEKYFLTLKALKNEEVQVEIQKNAVLSELADQKALDDATKLQNELDSKQAMIQSQLNQQVAAQYAAGQAISISNAQIMTSFSTGWTNAYANITQKTRDWAQTFSDIQKSIIAGTTSAFATFFNDVGTNFSNFGKLISGIGDAIKQAFINVAAQMAAEWLMQHVIMKGITLAWKAVEIASAAAVGAARAAAASAWTLWGAIALGAAIGSGIISLGNSFANGGIVGGSNFSGDKVVANVNSGEMILNRSQQKRLFDIANGSPTSGIVVNVSGNYILDEDGANGLADKISDTIMQRVMNERNI